MSLVSRVRGWWITRSSAGKPKPIRRRQRPQLEVLENRTVPTGLTKLLFNHPMPILPHPPAGDVNAPQYVAGLYYDLLNREPNAAEVQQSASGLLAGGERWNTVWNMLTSNEYHTRVITDQYYLYLHRAPESAGLNYWLSRMNSGLTAQQLMAALLSSDEYYQSHGSTGTGWLTGLYQDLLGRAPDQGGLGAWSQSLALGTSRVTIAQGFVQSHEGLGRQVIDVYERLLSRLPEAQGARAWVNGLEHGMTFEQLTAGVASSTEYYNLQLGATVPIKGVAPADDGYWNFSNLDQGLPTQSSSTTTDANGSSSATDQGSTTGSDTSAGTGTDAGTGSDNSITTAGGGITTDNGQDSSSTGNSGAFGSGGSYGGTTGGSGYGYGSHGGGSGSNGSGGSSGSSGSGSGSSGGIISGGTGSQGSSGQGTGSTGGSSGSGNTGSGTGGIINNGNSSATTRSNGASIRAQTSSSPILAVRKNVNISRHRGTDTEATIAIDPVNPLWLWSMSNTGDGGLWGGYSHDGGRTWVRRQIAGGADGLTPACCDPTSAFDSFGNLFIGYVSDTLDNVILNLSTDGGITFRPVTTIPAKFSPVADQPTIATGANSVWITYNDTFPMATGAPVTGLGQVGQFNTPEFIFNATNDGNFGDIAIGPNGEVLVAYQANTNLNNGLGPDFLRVLIDPDGLGSFKFINAPVTVAGPVPNFYSTNVGGFRPIGPQPDGFGVDAEVALAWDRSNGPHRGRAYMVYTDAPSFTSDDTNIMLRYSDDMGRTWSPAKMVNDDHQINSQFLPKLAIDQSTGNIAIAWHDARMDLGKGSPGDSDGIANDEAEYWGTVSLDGGQTFLPNVQISVGSSLQAGDDPPPAGLRDLDYGDYTGLTFAHGRFYGAWADNSNSTGDNPDGRHSHFDIYTAEVDVLGGGGGGGGSGGGGSGGGSSGSEGGVTSLPDDRFEPNETSDKATAFGSLTAAQNFSNLTINRHTNGLVDNDWYTWSIPQTGTVTVQINYQTLNSGDLHLRVYTYDTQGSLVQLGSSRNLGATSQKVIVNISQGNPLLVWVYGFNNEQGTYSMNVSLS